MKTIFCILFMFAFQLNAQINHLLNIDALATNLIDMQNCNEEVYITFQYANEMENGSGLIKLTDSTSKTEYYPFYSIGLNTQVCGESSMYMVGNAPEYINMLIQEVDLDNLDLLQNYSFNASENFTITSGSVRIADTIYVVNVNRTDDYDVITGGEYLQLWKLGLNGQVYRTVKLNQGMRGSYAFKMTANEDNNSLLISSRGLHYHKSGQYLSLLNLDTNGDIIWHYIGENEVEGPPTKVATLKDGNILAAYLEDQFYNDDWDFSMYDGHPVRVDWISQEGDLIKRRLYASLRTDRIQFDDIVASQDGGAFIFGSANEEEFSSRSGLLVKIDSEGDTVWSGFYTHPDFSPAERYNYHIKDLVERPDSSILVLATFSYPGEKSYSWVFELDAEGCHDTTICSTPVIVDIKDVEINVESLHLYPNPANDYIILDHLERADEITMINNMGQSVIHKYIDSSTESYRLDIKDIPKGLYYVRKKSSNGRLYLGKVVKY